MHSAAVCWFYASVRAFVTNAIRMLCTNANLSALRCSHDSITVGVESSTSLAFWGGGSLPL